MKLALWSLALAVLGVGASRWAAAALRGRPLGTPARIAWIAGLPSLLLAWLVPFLSLLGAAGEAGGPPRVAFFLASATAILGVLASDALLTREEGGGGRPHVGWLLGVLALLPAWLTALLIATLLPG